MSIETERKIQELMERVKALEERLAYLERDLQNSPKSTTLHVKPKR